MSGGVLADSPNGFLLSPLGGTVLIRTSVSADGVEGAEFAGVLTSFDTNDSTGMLLIATVGVASLCVGGSDGELSDRCEDDPEPASEGVTRACFGGEIPLLLVGAD